MLHTLRLLAPALIPSWRFFREVAPSPRIEYALVAQPDQPPPGWAPARPRPGHLPVSRMLLRLFWNPGWNETLYLVTLSERLAVAPTAQDAEEIGRRILRDLGPGEGYLRFRLVFLRREGGGITRSVAYLSAPIARTPGA
ncbi:hypothetical protein FDP22_24270 (plasmid) [Paroceanicella profunda]|uniref:Uncharacterized protein n=1 Tax=Paroceanicella profunda TaxID=2579971 RepID=A0A5B8FJX3_9RHOB|nr:hypothetical protein [Paroceanicella profunda]QDL94977.1 hypothetical protein FDP22_24270 [Paroceanicella profunda]